VAGVELLPVRAQGFFGGFSTEPDPASRGTGPSGNQWGDDDDDDEENDDDDDDD
jgi:hypothetical protein